MDVDAEYMAAAQAGDMDRCACIVREQAEKLGSADRALPEETEAYRVRTEPAPSKTVKAYKIFYVDREGRPSALFAGGCVTLPAGVWIDAKDQWSFRAPNGRRYIPGCRNPNRSLPGGKPKNRAGGSAVPVPEDPEEHRILVERGFVGPRAKSVKALAHRPGWHAGLLPFFPQGGKRDKDSPYGNVHEWNQVVFEVELSADRDWTAWARAQDKAKTKDGGISYREAGLDFLPEGGSYRYAPNPLLDARDETWFIADSMRIVRPLSQAECDSILAARGMPPQAWEQGEMRLEDLGVDPASCPPAETLAPVVRGAGGRIVPLAERFRTAAPEEEEEESPSPAP